MTIEIPETYMGKPIKGSIEIAIAEQKRRNLEEKVQQERAAASKPNPAAQTPVPTSVPSQPIIPPQNYSKIFDKIQLDKTIYKNYNKNNYLNKIIEKEYIIEKQY